MFDHSMNFFLKNNSNNRKCKCNYLSSIKISLLGKFDKLNNIIELKYKSKK